MKHYRNLLSILALAVLFSGGCIPKGGLGALFKPEENDGEKNGHMQQQHDPMHPEEKGQSGVEYNPYEWVAGHYSPDTISRVITSQGRKGVTQKTFTESGGDFNVHISLDGRRMIYATTKWCKTPQIAMQGVSSKAMRRHTDNHMSDMMPKFHPNSPEIAWCSNRAGNWDIWVQHVGGKENSAPQQLTRSSDDEIHPCYSPDGKLIAYSRYNSNDGTWQIWVIDIKNRVVNNITTGLFPEFRPVQTTGANGKPKYTIAFQRNRTRDVPFYSIWTVDIQMSDDGSVDVVGSPTEIISNHEWAAISPAWSPDGEYLCFATVRKSILAKYQARIYRADDIWVVKKDGTNLTQITSHSAPDWEPFWAKDPNDPNGPGRIYFSSSRSGQPNIWSVKPVIASLLHNPEMEGKDNE